MSFFLPAGPAVLYGRVSTADQTVETQDANMRAYVGRFPELRFDPALVFLDPDTSGGIPLRDRPSGGELVAALRARAGTPGAIRHLVAMRLDRLGRDSLDIIACLRWLWAEGVTPHFVDMGPMPQTPLNEACLSVGAVFAQLERDLIRGRTRDKMQRLRAQGKPTGGSVPYGFRAADVAGVTHWVKDDREQRTLDQMRAMHDAGHTYGAIARWLNREGIPTKTGREWKHATVESVLTSKSNQTA